MEGRLEQEWRAGEQEWRGGEQEWGGGEQELKGDRRSRNLADTAVEIKENGPVFR